VDDVFQKELTNLLDFYRFEKQGSCKKAVFLQAEKQIGFQ
jgi:hypothetical protein